MKASSSDFIVDLRNSLGHTGLYLTAAFGHVSLVKSLVQLGADTTVQCGQHVDALYVAVFNNHIDVVRTLIHDAFNLPSQDIRETALQTAFVAGRENAARLLLDINFLVSCQTEYDALVDNAAQTGFPEILHHMSQLYPASSRSYRPSSKALTAAVGKGQLSAVRRYLERGMQVDHPIATAALFG